MNSDPLQGGAAATYNAASDFYDVPASFRDRFGQVDRRSAGAAARCSSPGYMLRYRGLALAAAEAVGPSGSVLGLDLAERAG